MDSLIGNWSEHLALFFGGMGIWSLLGYAVQTAPTPKNVYGRWALGVAQYAVGQHIAAGNTMKGLDTVRGALPIELRGTETGVMVLTPPVKENKEGKENP